MTDLQKLEDRVKAKIRDIISKHSGRFQCEGFLGDADNGVAVVIREIMPDGQQRKFVLKAAAEPGEEAVMLGEEMRYLTQLQYASHICRQVHLNDSPFDLLRVPWSYVPFYTMEYLPNGTLEQFYNRVWAAGEVLPNRVLWSIFLCLVRACIGMAYPPPGPEIEVERVRSDVPLSGICHYDMLDGNFMFADFTGGPAWVQEHASFPPLKLIDFGRAFSDPEVTHEPPDPEDLYGDDFDAQLGLGNYRVSGPRNQSTDENILAAGMVMARLVHGKTHHGAGEGVARDVIRTRAIRPDLDADLRFIIARCLAVDPRNRPRLEEFQFWIDQGVFHRPAERYGAAGQGYGPESDGSLQRIYQLYILNAPTAP
ncbi:hypothetical protein F4806DRAFT_86746 [Annulohypoxylon nitens]|nr:hypothetical protein F4806DRAFT_86746 [Annulohypoxylon nitens]